MLSFCQSYLQVLAIGLDSATGNTRGRTANDTGMLPDVLSIARAAADSCRLLRTLSMRTPDCVQQLLRDPHGHEGLAALSQLTLLSSLRLVNVGVPLWPSTLSCLSNLQQLTVFDLVHSTDPMYHGSGGAVLAWPLPHNLQTLPSLTTLYSGVFRWEDPLPTSLTSLMLDCGELSSIWDAACPKLLPELLRLPQLQQLALQRASWLCTHMQQLVDTLQQCRRLRGLQLISACGCTAELLLCLTGLAHLHSFALVDREWTDLVPLQLSQLASCKRLHWQQHSYSLHDSAVLQLAPHFAAMPSLEILSASGTSSSDRDNEALEIAVREARAPSLPAVRVVQCAVPLLSEARRIVEIPMSACNGVLGQQLDQMVYDDAIL